MISLRARRLLPALKNPYFEWGGRGFLAHFLTSSSSFEDVKLGGNFVKFTTFPTLCIQKSKLSTWNFRNEELSSKRSSKVFSLNCGVNSKVRTFPPNLNINKLHSCAVLNAYYRGKNRQKGIRSSKSFKGKPGIYSSSSRRHKNAKYSEYSKSTDFGPSYLKLDGSEHGYHLHKGMLEKLSQLRCFEIIIKGYSQERWSLYIHLEEWAL